MIKERFSFLDYALFGLIIVIFAVFSFIFQVNQIFSFDQTQMLIKGYFAALSGEYLPFGNEASTTGNLPGSLSSFVIGFPFSVYFHAYSPIFFQILLRIVAILFFANGLAQIFPRKIVLAGTFLFALSTWTLMQGMLYNPAYLPVGACAFFCGIVHLRNDNEAHISVIGRVWWSMLSVLGIGWCLQFHFSWPVLLFIAGIMWLRGDLKVSYVGLFLGALIVGLSLWPYIQELIANPTLARSPDGYGSERYLGYGFVHVYPVFKGLLYWFRFGSLLFTQKAIVPEFDYDEDGLGVALIAYTWIGISSLIGGITVIFAAYCNYFTIFKYRLSNHTGRLRFIRGITFSSIFAVLIAAGLNTLTLNYWQIAIIMPFALIPVLTFMAQQPRVFKRYMTVAVFFLAASNTLAATYSSDYDVRVNYRKELYQNCLLAFNQHQCQPLSEGLTQQDLEDAQKTKIDPEVILRVIDGIKPLPWNADEEYINQYKQARQTIQHYKFALPQDVKMPPLVHFTVEPDNHKAQEQVKEAKKAAAEQAHNVKQLEQNESQTKQQNASQSKQQNSATENQSQPKYQSQMNKATATENTATADTATENSNSLAGEDKSTLGPQNGNIVLPSSSSQQPVQSVQNSEQQPQSPKYSQQTKEPTYVQPATAPIESDAFKPQSGKIVDKANGTTGEIMLY